MYVMKHSFNILGYGHLLLYFKYFAVVAVVFLLSSLMHLLLFYIVWKHWDFHLGIILELFAQLEKRWTKIINRSKWFSHIVYFINNTPCIWLRLCVPALCIEWWFCLCLCLVVVALNWILYKNKYKHLTKNCFFHFHNTRRHFRKSLNLFMLLLLLFVFLLIRISCEKIFTQKIKLVFQYISNRHKKTKWMQFFWKRSRVHFIQQLKFTFRWFVLFVFCLN